MNAVLSILIASALLAQPIEPAETIERFNHDPGIRIDVIASEPLVVDPVAIAWDEHGTCYVVENRGYPTAEPDTHPGTIVTLADTDGDGRYDTRTLYAEGFDYPNGILPWEGGVLVTDSPSLLYLRDEDGDGRADTREPILEGFAPGGSTQLRVSHPTLGTDGWLYMTNGLSGGDIQVTKGDGTVVSMGANDLRYNPRTMQLETIAGRAQFGLTFDDYGNRFICSNRNHVQHIVLEPDEVGRNPYAPRRSMVNDIPEHGAAAKLYPISENKTTAYSHIGTFTAACGLVIYRGTGLGEAYTGNAFVCDPTGNLVHRDVLRREGITFVATRGEEESEFLRSTDEWFRPVYLTNGPDGALYLCDMYRGTIEHPRYLPADLAARTDFERGKDRGRIYRIAAKDNPPHAIDTSSTHEEPVTAISARDGWQSDTAQRLLLENLDAQDAADLRTALQRTENESARIKLLHLLDAKGALTKDDMIAFAGYASPEFQAARIRIAARFVGDPEVDSSIQAAIEKNEPLQSAASLHAIAKWPDTQSVQALSAIIQSTPMNDWLRGAVYSTAYGHGPALLSSLIPHLGGDDSEVVRTLARETAQDHGVEAVAAVFTGSGNSEVTEDLLDGALEGLLRRGGLSASPLDTLVSALDPTPALRDSLVEKKAEWIRQAEGQGEQDRRLRAVRMLTYTDEADAAPRLARCLTTENPEAIQLAAIASLSGFSDATVSTTILAPATWQALTPRARVAAIDALLLRGARIDALFDAIDGGDVSPRSLSALQRNRLLRSGNESVKSRASTTFAALNAGRADALAKFQPATTMEGDVEKGATHYEKICASCHVFQGQGSTVGPELSDIRAKTAETILLHIIEPNREVTSGYETCEVETVDGDTYTGILADDNETGITLKQAFGNTATIARADIAAVRTAPLSLMPEGVEEGLTVQDMADLIAFLRRDL